jgi:hypothetical protein
MNHVYLFKTGGVYQTTPELVFLGGQIFAFMGSVDSHQNALSLSKLSCSQLFTKINANVKAT